VIGWLLVAPLSLCAAARAARLEESSSLLLLATGLTPLLGPPALVALGIGLWQRRWPLAVVSAAMAAAHLSSALSGLGVPARDPAPAGKPAALRLFSANVHHANRDLGRIGQEIRAAAPDLVALHEVDPDGAASLQRSGVLARFSLCRDRAPYEPVRDRPLVAPAGRRQPGAGPPRHGRHHGHDPCRRPPATALHGPHGRPTGRRSGPMAGPAAMGRGGDPPGTRTGGRCHPCCAWTMSSSRRTSACDRSGRASARAATTGRSSPSSSCGRRRLPDP
jgi:hypothetical protein